MFSSQVIWVELHGLHGGYGWHNWQHGELGSSSDWEKKNSAHVFIYHFAVQIELSWEISLSVKQIRAGFLDLWVVGKYQPDITEIPYLGEAWKSCLTVTYFLAR